MEIIKCGFFMIPKLTKKYWYFAFFLIGAFLRIVIPDIFNILFNIKIEENNELKILLTQKYFEIIRNIGSDLLMGIFHFIYIIRNKDEYERRTQIKYIKENTKINFIFNDETRRTPRIFKLLLVISIIDITCQLSLPIKYLIENKLDRIILITPPFHLNSLLVIDIISRYLFSLWILRTYFYAHHNLSFILNFIALLALGVVDLKFKYFIDDKNNDDKYDIIYIIVIAIQYILYSLEDIVNKVAFRTLYLLPTTLIFYKGLFELIAFFPIISVGLFYFKLYDFNNIFILRDVKSALIFFLTFIPFNILRTFSLVNVIDRFTAQHMSFLKVSEAIILFGYFLYMRKEEKFNLELWAYIVQIIAFVILLLSSLIHNEIIIINLPKLKAKTEYYLDKDADNEQNSSYYSDTLLTSSRDITTTSVSNIFSDFSGSEF